MSRALGRSGVAICSALAALECCAALSLTEFSSLTERGSAVRPWSWSHIARPGGIQPAGRQGHAAVEIGRQIYIIAGCRAARLDDAQDPEQRELDRRCYNDVHVFDTQTRLWSQGPFGGQAPKPRSGHSATLVAGDIFVFGGSSGEETFGDVLRLDPKRKLWSPVPSVGPSGGAGPGRRTGHAGAVDSGGQIYIFGGYGAHGELLNDIWILSLSSAGGVKRQDGVEFLGTWSKAEPRGAAPAPREAHTLTYVDGKLVLFGGFTAAGKSSNDLHTYDLQAQRWTQLDVTGPRPGPRQAQAAVRHGEHLIVAGGCDVSSDKPMCYGDVWSLSFTQKRWTRRSSDNATWRPRRGHSAVFVRGELFAFGGCGLGSVCYNDVAVMDTQDPCPNACGRHGICSGGAFCDCKTPGFTGHDCMEPLVCPAPGCGIHGVCAQSGNCTCEEGWAGPTCALELEHSLGAIWRKKLRGVTAGLIGQISPIVAHPLVGWEEKKQSDSSTAAISPWTTTVTHAGFLDQGFGVSKIYQNYLTQSPTECADSCNFRGLCAQGICYCQPSYYGRRCEFVTSATGWAIKAETVLVFYVAFFFIAFSLTFLVLLYRAERKRQAAALQRIQIPQ